MGIGGEILWVGGTVVALLSRIRAHQGGSVPELPFQFGYGPPLPKSHPLGRFSLLLPGKGKKEAVMGPAEPGVKGRKPRFRELVLFMEADKGRPVGVFAVE